MMRFAVCALMLFGAQAASSDAKVSPIEKVLVMLKDLQEKVVIEGRNEAVTYDKYACYCKDMTDEKSTAIEEGQTAVDSLVGKINAANSDRNTIDEKIEDLNEEIATLEKEMAEETKKHLENKAIYEEDRKVITESLESVRDGESVVAGGAGVPHSSNSLIAIKKEVKRSMQGALVLADKLGVSKPEYDRHLNSFLQMSEDPADLAKAESYQVNDELQGVISTLESLENDFISQRKQLDETEAKRVFSYDSFMQQRHDTKNVKLKNLAKQQEMHAKKMSEKAQLQQELTQEQASLHDDQAFIQDLTDKCNAKSAEWDERTDMRTQELSALTSAIDIIQSRIADSIPAESTRASLAQIAVPSAIADAEDVVDEEDPATDEFSFLQVAAPRSRLTLLAKAARVVRESPEAIESQEAARQMVLSLLRSRGEELKSSMLVSLANKVSDNADPFSKITTLIEELIGRLKQEAADEASHKGWCDKSLGDAEIRRDDQISKVTNLNSALSRHQTRKDKLVERISELKDSLEELRAFRSKITKARKAEKEENKQTISEAKEGLEAINDAIDVLKDYYDKAKEPEFVQLSSDPTKAEMAEGTSSTTGKYEGSQSAMTGIIGMMEVIVGDFKRTIRTTGDEEDKAQRDFKGIKRTTQVSIDTKRTEKENKASELSTLRETINTELKDLKNEQSILDKAIQELLDLVPACIETGMSYEDRVAKREQEVESLNNALCILEQQGPTKESTQTCD